MAVTVQFQPANLGGYLPSFNPQWFVATSTQVAQPNFFYRVIVTDIISSITKTYDIIPNPSNECEIDVSRFSRLRMNNYIPINEYGWQKATGIRKIRVNIGEVWDIAGVPTYTAGSNVDYIVWNACLEMLSFSSFASTQYVYDGSIPIYKYLTSSLTENVYENRSNLFYVLIQEGNVSDIADLEINTYLANGTLVNSSTIARPDFNTGVYTDQYVCIDLGIKGLNGLTAPEVAGSYPVLAGNESYYTVTDNTDPLNPVIIKRYDICCEPQYTVYTLHFLCRNGKYGTLHCTKAAELTTTKQVNTYKKSPWTRSGYVKAIDYSVIVENTQSVVSQDGLKLNSDWLTQAQFDFYKELFTSSDVKLDLGSSQGYASVKVNQTSYTQQNDGQKLRNYQIDLLFTHTNPSQNG